MKRILAILLTAGITFTAAAESKEYEVKAAFIYNFTKFIEWPATVRKENDKLDVCVLGTNPFGPALDALQDMEVQGREIAVQRLNNTESLMGCEIVYISNSEQANLDSIISGISQTDGVLSISDIPGFAEQGGTIEFRLVDNKVRFLINQKAARQAGLTISSRLLQLAIKLVSS